LAQRQNAERGASGPASLSRTRRSVDFAPAAVSLAGLVQSIEREVGDPNVAVVDECPAARAGPQGPRRQSVQVASVLLKLGQRIESDRIASQQRPVIAAERFVGAQHRIVLWIAGREVGERFRIELGGIDALGSLFGGGRQVLLTCTLAGKGPRLRM